MVLPTAAFAASRTFDDQVPDNYGPILSLDELTFESESGTWLAVTNASAGSGLGIANSAPNKLSTFGVEPPTAGLRTGLTVQFKVPAKYVDFRLTGISNDTTIKTYDFQNNLLATVTRTASQTGPVQITASAMPISKVFIQPSVYDGFSIDDVCYQADASYTNGVLVTFEYPGYTAQVITPDLGSHAGSPRGAHDTLGNFYYPSEIPGEAGTVIRRRTPTGSIDLFAEINAAYQLRDLTFDPQGNMVLALKMLGCAPAPTTPLLALVRVTGFGTAPSPDPVATPTISPNGGTFTSTVSVTLATTTSGASIRYTLDGSTPTSLSPLYTSPISISSSATLKVVGFKSSTPDSAVASAAFTIQSSTVVSTPVISPAGGSFVGSVQVSLSTATSGATIRYTQDGTTPTASSTAYTTPFTLTSSKTVKAIAIKSGMTNSGVASADFTVTPAGGSSITAPGANTSARSLNGWTVSGTEIYASSANNWLEYEVDFGSGGSCAFSLTAINNTNPSAPGLPSGYSFAITVQVDGVSKGTIQVPGSTTTYRTASVTGTAPAGVHNVRFTWTNDAWSSGVYDANIRVRDVGFSPALRTINTATLPRVMPAGDSTTTGKGDTNSFGYRDHLLSRLGFGNYDFTGTFRSPTTEYTFDLDNEGLGGDRADQLEARMPYALVTTMPTPNPAGSAILVHIGTNDLGQGVGNSTIVQNIADIVSIINSHDPTIAVYVAQIIPNTNSVDDALITSFNSALATKIAQLQATKSNLYLVNMNAVFKQNANWKTTYYYDEVHPNDAGYQVMAAEWERNIRLH